MIDEIVGEQLLENIEVSLPLDRFGHDREDRADSREKKNWRDRQFDRMGYSNVREFKHELPQACSNRQIKAPKRALSDLQFNSLFAITAHQSSAGLMVGFLWLLYFGAVPAKLDLDASAVATPVDRCR